MTGRPRTLGFLTRQRQGARVLALSVVALALLLVLPAAASAFNSYFRGASDDGSKVFFETADAMVPADDDGGGSDVYQRSGGVTTLISTNTAGTANGNFGGAGAEFVGTSADGSKVFFETPESLAASDADGGDFDLYERSAGVTTQVSTNTAGTANVFGTNVHFLRASADGSKVFFFTRESLAASDSDGTELDIYERSSGCNDPGLDQQRRHRQRRHRRRPLHPRLHRRLEGLLPDIREHGCK